MTESEPEYRLFAIIIICRWLSRASEFVPCIRDIFFVVSATLSTINIITDTFIIATIIIFTVTIIITLQINRW